MKINHDSLGTANAQIFRLMEALQHIADDPDTNIEAAAYARNIIADETAWLKHLEEA